MRDVLDICDAFQEVSVNLAAHKLRRLGVESPLVRVYVSVAVATPLEDRLLQQATHEALL